MAKKRPCRICRRWFRPDPRVGDRQRACSRPECQQERRSKTQAVWRSRNPEYYHHRRLTARSAAAKAAGKAAAAVAAERVPKHGGGRPAVLTMPASLARVPWDLMQDEIGVRVTDAIAVTTREILRAVKDQRRSQLTEGKEGPDRVRGQAMKDQIAPAAPL
jgi:hypothetical protein